MKRLFFALASSVAMLTTGCGGGADDADSGGNKSAGSASDVAGVIAELEGMGGEQVVEHLLSGAEAEGGVVFYGEPTIETLEQFKGGFEETYPGVTVQFVRLKGTDLAQRALTEGRAGKLETDVILNNAVDISAIIDEGFLADHGSVVVPDGYPAEAIGDTWAGYGIYPNMIAWNTDLVSADEAPEDYEDLLHPKWKGKVAIDVSSENFIAGMINDRGVDKTRDFLEELVVENEAIVRSGHTNISNLLAAGAFPLATELYAYRLESLKTDDKAPIDYTGASFIPVNVQTIGVTKTAKNPYAALLFMHYLLSAEGQTHYAEGGDMPLNPDAEVKSEPLKELISDPRLRLNTPDAIKDVYADAARLSQELLSGRVIPE
jgi:iron(III) transport system substrate-binding protein